MVTLLVLVLCKRKHPVHSVKGLVLGRHFPAIETMPKQKIELGVAIQLTSISQNVQHVLAGVTDLHLLMRMEMMFPWDS